MVANRVKDFWQSCPGQNLFAKSILAAPDRVPFPFRRWRLSRALWISFIAALPKYHSHIVIAVGWTLTFTFALIKRILRVRNLLIGYEVLISESYFDPRKVNSLRHSLVQQLTPIISKSVDLFIVNSSHEIGFFQQLNPYTKVEFIPLYSGIKPKRQYRSLRVSKNVFSGGAAYRDFSTFLQAMELLDGQYRAKLATRPQFLSFEDIPENVELITNLDSTKFNELMAQISIVVIPLQPTSRSAGQITIIRAQCLGCIVIASSIPAVRDYVIDGTTGLLVPPRDPKAIANAILKLEEDPALVEFIRKQTFKYCEENYTASICADRIKATITNLSAHR